MYNLRILLPLKQENMSKVTELQNQLSPQPMEPFTLISVRLRVLILAQNNLISLIKYAIIKKELPELNLKHFMVGKLKLFYEECRKNRVILF